MQSKKVNEEKIEATHKGVPQIPIVFMGTPEFSATILKTLLDAHYRVVGVVTQPDKPVGRKQELVPSPVKKLSLAAELPVLEPVKLGATEVKEILAWKADLIVVAAYGKILPEALLSGPGMGCVNVHTSLLPRWRGASPIQNALMAGDTTTGVTLMLMDKGVDTGDIIAQRTVPIEPAETAGLLSARLAKESAGFILEMLPQWITRKIAAVPQEEAEVTVCQLIEREDGKVFWSEEAIDIYNRYRGLTPWPGLFTFWKKNEDILRLKLLEISLQKTSPLLDEPLGKVFEVGEKIGVRTGSGIIFLERVQLEGKESVLVRDFLNGNPDFIGSVLL